MTDPEQIPHDADPPFAIARHAELVARFEALGEQLARYDAQQASRLHGIEQILTTRAKLSGEEQRMLYRAWLIANDIEHWYPGRKPGQAGKIDKGHIALMGLCTIIARVCNIDLPAAEP